MPFVVHDFAILAPVPLVHLQSGLEVAGKGFVAFGTENPEQLEKADAMRGDDPIPLLIYASHGTADIDGSFAVSWVGSYFRHVDGKDLNAKAHRPPSTASDTGDWKALYCVRGLRELAPDKRVAIDKIKTLEGKPRKNARVRAIALVQMPETLSYENF